MTQPLLQSAVAVGVRPAVLGVRRSRAALGPGLAPSPPLQEASLNPRGAGAQGSELAPRPRPQAGGWEPIRS